MQRADTLQSELLFLDWDKGGSEWAPKAQGACREAPIKWGGVLWRVDRGS
jgi:hypothetical protein